MPHANQTIASLLKKLDLGDSVAETDSLLHVARVDTSAFSDLLNDRVDLVPGTKGSGKSALFRIFIDFLPDMLLQQHKVVVAHGIQAPGDPVFHAFKEQFSQLNEEQFVNFWCVYLVSLAREQFLKGDRYRVSLTGVEAEIKAFQSACGAARIPEIQGRRSLRDILQWALEVCGSWSPKVKYKLPNEAGVIELDLFPAKDTPAPPQLPTEQPELPKYVNDIRETLQALLNKANLSLWLMVDRLDEIFPRRTELESIALRGLLQAMRFFSSDSIRVKVFLRDDMLEQVVRTSAGFTGLTHVTARQADTLRWAEDQILSMVVKRIFANQQIANYLSVDKNRLDASAEYRVECFNLVFPPTVHRGKKQSTTIRWLHTRCADGRGVVTPRDVIDLLKRAAQRQQDDCSSNPSGSSAAIIGSSAVQYGLRELSLRKRTTYLEAEFPQFWPHIQKFIGGKTEFDENAIRKVLGRAWETISDDLVAIGVLKRTKRENQSVYWIPYVYRHGLNVTQGKA